MSDMGYAGLQKPGDGQGEFSAMAFIIEQLLGRVATATLVRIVSVTNNGGLSPVGFVDVQPLINQVDGANNAMPHGIVHNLPYFRLQGGTDAVIMDPKVGDIGMAAFASRDISAVKASKKQNNPGSGRMFDMADGLYFGGFLNGVPVQYVQFTGGGINIVSPNAVKVQAPSAAVECETSTVNATASASVTAPAISLGASGQSLLSFVTSTFMGLFNGHTHPDAHDGNTDVPNQKMSASHMTTTVKGG